MSKSTKELLSAALVELLNEKHLEKVTVGEIASRCDVSRMTFYYHFKDIKDLIRWTFINRAGASLQNHPESAGWKNSLAQLLAFMRDNKSLMLTIYQSIGYLQFSAVAKEILLNYAQEDFNTAAGMFSIGPEDRAFVFDFFSNSIIGICYEWIGRGMDPAEAGAIVNNCATALSGSVVGTLKAFDVSD